MILHLTIRGPVRKNPPPVKRLRDFYAGVMDRLFLFFMSLKAIPREGEQPRHERLNDIGRDAMSWGMMPGAARRAAAPRVRVEGGREGFLSSPKI